MFFNIEREVVCVEKVIEKAESIQTELSYLKQKSWSPTCLDSISRSATYNLTKVRLTRPLFICKWLK